MLANTRKSCQLSSNHFFLRLHQTNTLGQICSVMQPTFTYIICLMSHALRSNCSKLIIIRAVHVEVYTLLIYYKTVVTITETLFARLSSLWEAWNGSPLGPKVYKLVCKGRYYSITTPFLPLNAIVPNKSIPVNNFRTIRSRRTKSSDSLPVGYTKSG